MARPDGDDDDDDDGDEEEGGAFIGTRPLLLLGAIIATT
jgi:hypothetical protein